MSMEENIHAVAAQQQNRHQNDGESAAEDTVYDAHIPVFQLAQKPSAQRLGALHRPDAHKQSGTSVRAETSEAVRAKTMVNPTSLKSCPAMPSIRAIG